MDSDSESAFSCTPPDVQEVAQSAIHSLLPEKSKKQYEIAYKLFKDWCMKNKVRTASENVLLGYLEEKSKTTKSSTLWSIYSMLKATLNINENIDITKFSKLVPYLKKKSVGYRPKKSKILTRDEIQKFLSEADDENYLLIKVALIFGISGAMRRDELTKLTVNNIEDRRALLVINIPDSKTHSERTFTITHHHYMEIYRKYAALRPVAASTNRFFYKYQNGKCVNQVVGINKFGGMPCVIAKFLKLPNEKLYTGHCFRRTSATLLADSGADITMVKRHGGWKSTTVAENYLEDSIPQKNKISNKILDVGDVDNYLLSSKVDISCATNTNKDSNVSSSDTNVNNYTSCTFNIYNGVRPKE